ncbi:MAG TPA: hypothetical protein VG326_13055 [Tepidisphaeraceae bacterium]|nr:hypothetical protein [Tepidisphaeraceae bacterium]
MVWTGRAQGTADDPADRPAEKARSGHDGSGPWKMAGEQINILAVYQDADLPERYHHSSATKPPGGWFHHAEPYWQVFKLIDGNNAGG